MEELSRITDDVKFIESYINKTWPQFTTELEVRLSKLLPEPENKDLKHIWTYGSADLTVSRDGKLICIVETGGGHHMQDEKQIRNDDRKCKLCQINDVNCLQMMNGIQKSLSKRQWRNLLGRFIWGLK